MSPPLVAGLVLLALAATLGYFRGVSRNRAIAASIAGGLEEALRPVSTEYVNVGGAIGHNFTFRLAGDWTEARGVFTLSPRHSLLYLPVSRLLGVRDRLFLNVFTTRPFRGEGHVVRASDERRAGIAGSGEMGRREVEIAGLRFLLLWREADLSAALEDVLRGMPDPARLRHFCAYPGTGTFFLRTEPAPGSVAEDVSAVLQRTGPFLAPPNGIAPVAVTPLGSPAEGPGPKERRPPAELVIRRDEPAGGS